MPYHLTEDNIKHATLSFLKSYYKDNSSRGFGDTVAKIDMQAGDGIIADGYIKFSVDSNPILNMSSKEAEQAMLEDQAPTPEKHETFLATFEATSQKTAQEIQYRIQKSLLIFDALAVASIIAATSYGYNYLNDQYTLNQLGTFKFFAGFFTVLLASAIVYIYLFRKIARYHHIHALAQFRKYHADEQWVSFGEDVFANPNNKYLLELKKQCIKEGFGLISVDKDLSPTLLITPARKLKKSNKNSKVVQFFRNTANSKAFKWADGVKMPTFQSPIDTTDYTRYTKSFWKQALVILAMLFVIGEIYLEELKNPNIIYVDESKYKKQLQQKTDKIQTEPNEFTLEDEVENEPTTYYKQPEESETITPNTPIAPVSSPKSTSSPTKIAKKDALIISTGYEEYVSYDCNRLSAMKGKHYLVQIATANSSTEAIRTVKSFNENGFKANAVWLGCFINKKIYVIYLDDIFNSQNAATERLKRYQKLLIAKNQNPETAILRMIEGGE